MPAAESSGLALRPDTADALWTAYIAEVAKRVSGLQLVFDEFVVRSIRGRRVTFVLENTVSRRHRANGEIDLGARHVGQTWAGAGHWTVEDLMLEVSAVRRGSPGAINLRYRELLDQVLEPHFIDCLRAACKHLARSSPALLEQLRQELQAGQGREASSAGSTAESIADQLRCSQLAELLKYAFSSALVRAQGTRTLSSWVPAITSDENLVPRVRKASFNRPRTAANL